MAAAKLDKKTLETRASVFFKDYPEAGKVFMSEDGFAFQKENDAVNYTNLKDLAVLAFDKPKKAATKKK